MNEAQSLKSVEASFARVQAMASIGCWELDLSDREDINRNTLSWSAGLFVIFGYEPFSVHVTNELFFNAVHPADRDAIAKAVAEALRDRKPYVIEHRIIRKDGEVRHVREHADVVCAPDGRIVSMFGTTQDVTERKQAQQELKALNAELDARVQARTADLEMFAYAASHDLRAPLRALLGGAEALAADLAGRVPPDAEARLKGLAGSARRMDRLITDLLALSHAAKAELAVGVVDLDALVRELMSHYPRWSQGSVRARGPLGRVLACESLLAQSIANLVDNALKFTPSGAAPDVEISTEREGRRARVVVSDRGLGIDPAYHEKIFAPFARLHPTERYEGSGIGLAIVKKSIERMGGSVGVESAPGKGSRFWLELPAA